MNIKNFFLKKIYNSEEDLTPINLNLFSFIVTTKCNLRCKGCDNFIDKYIHPSTPKSNVLISDAKALLECVNKIDVFKIIGGEPFLNKDLNVLLTYLFEGEYFYKIGRIRIMTNGTVIPSEETLRIMEKYKEKIYVYVTVYGEKSKKIIGALENYGINYELSDIDSEWRDSGGTEFRNRDEETLKKFYKDCFSKDMCNCCLNGEYHICPRSAHGKDLSIIPDYKSDYVNLRENTINERIAAINKLKKREYINCCNHCDLPLMKVVEKKCNMH